LKFNATIDQIWSLLTYIDEVYMLYNTHKCCSTFFFMFVCEHRCTGLNLLKTCFIRQLSQTKCYIFETAQRLPVLLANWNAALHSPFRNWWPGIVQWKSDIVIMFVMLPCTISLYYLYNPFRKKMHTYRVLICACWDQILRGLTQNIIIYLDQLWTFYLWKITRWVLPVTLLEIYDGQHFFFLVLEISNFSNVHLTYKWAVINP
jgi:hypothetical protein